MLKISNLKVKLSEGENIILHDVNLEVNPGEIHILNGRNGSGKSTLVNTIMGNPQFEVLDGKIEIVDEDYPEHIVESLCPPDLDQEDYIIRKNPNGKYDVDLTEAEPSERSLVGVFLANQYPVEIPGVNLMQYLRLIYNVRKSENDKLPFFKFKQLVSERARLINYPEHLLKRNLNEGFSGGEKKKTEILQMLVCEPRYVLLDEIDSGLDKESVQDVFKGLSLFHKQNPKTAFIIITHYDRVKEFLNLDFEHEMVNGKLK
ncbi:MAG: ABC transporter ATP-binding protein [Candidatus Dojkabacteria bacterium]|nr:MAG: ABC transporter ATP-binding protein [Candidatus Dojkabacteria bacterium]